MRGATFWGKSSARQGRAVARAAVARARAARALDLKTCELRRQRQKVAAHAAAADHRPRQGHRQQRPVAAAARAARRGTATSRPAGAGSMGAQAAAAAAAADGSSAQAVHRRSLIRCQTRARVTNMARSHGIAVCGVATIQRLQYARAAGAVVCRVAVQLQRRFRRLLRTHGAAVAGMTAMAASSAAHQRHRLRGRQQRLHRAQHWASGRRAVSSAVEVPRVGAVVEVGVPVRAVGLRMAVEIARGWRAPTM